MLSVRQFKHVLALGVLISMTACTRPEADRSKIEIVIPKSMSSEKIGSLSTELLSHVVINVSGPGIAEPILFEWSNRGANDEPNLNPPTSFTLDVPQGDSRLIQILTVYADMDTSMYSFYYGDASKALKAADESVVVPVSSIGQGDTIITGQISGRYFAAPDAGPTGKVFVKFKPSLDKPSLILEKSRIINGWFSFFAMQGAKFEYVMDNGKVLFGGPVNLADAQFNPNATNSKILRVTLPLSNRNESWAPGTYDWQTEEPMISIFGWFSDPGQESTTNGKVICRPSSPTALTRMGQFQQAEPTASRDLLIPAVNAAVPNASALYSTSNPLPNYYINGGVDHTNASCSPDTNNYLSFMKFKEFMVDGNGKDSAVPFRAPFRLLAPTNGGTQEYPIAISSPTAGTKRVSGHLLPGLLPMIDRFIAYKRIGPDFHVDSDRLLCPMVASGAHGFTQASQVSLSTDTFELDIPLTDSELAQQANVVLCGAKGDLIYDSALLIRSDMWGMTSGGGVTNPPNGFNLYFAKESISNKILKDVCYASGIELKYNNTGSTVSNSANRIFTLGGTTNGFTGAVAWYHSLADCNSQVNPQTTVTVNSGSNYAPLYFRVSESGGLDTSSISTDNVNLSAETADTLFTMNTTANTNYNIAISSTIADIKWSMGWIEMGSNDCRMISIFAVDQYGYPVILGTSVTVNLTGITGGGYFSDCSSTTAITTVNIPSGSFLAHLAIKSAPSISNQSVTASMPSPSVSDELIINPPKAYNRAEVFFLTGLPAVMFKNECYELQARGLDNLGMTLPNSLGFAVPIRFQNYGGMSAGAYYSSVDCISGGPTQSLDLSIASSNTNSPSVYFKYGNSANSHAAIKIDGYNPYLLNGFNNPYLNLPAPTDDPKSIFASALHWYDNASSRFSAGTWNEKLNSVPTTSSGTINIVSQDGKSIASLAGTNSEIIVQGSFSGELTIAGVFYLNSLPPASQTRVITKFTQGTGSATFSLKIHDNGDIKFYRDATAIVTLPGTFNPGWHRFLISKNIASLNGSFFVDVDMNYDISTPHATDDDDIDNNSITMGGSNNSADIGVAEFFVVTASAVTDNGTDASIILFTNERNLLMLNGTGYFSKKYPFLP